MNKFKLLSIALIISFSGLSLKGADNQSLKEILSSYIERFDARIGVAVMKSSGEIIEVNGTEEYPMLSVYKFPEALAVASYCDKNNISFSDSISIYSAEIKEDTYSPMRDKYGVRDLKLPLTELLAYSLQQSDNNACDILFDFIGGTAYADSVIRSWGYKNINLLSTEDEMHRNVMECYKNSAYPVDMVKLLRQFTENLRGSSPSYSYIAEMMESCSTGLNRLPRPLKEGDILGHKTGTSGLNESEVLIGIGDVGYFQLADGKKYTLAVFVSDFPGTLYDAENVIGEISEIVYQNITSQN